MASEQALLAPPVALDTLVGRLQRACGRYVLTSVSHGPHDAAVQRTLQALRALGVQERPRGVASELDDTGLRLIRIDAGPVAPQALLLVGISQAAIGLLLPAVQKVRDAAHRAPLKHRRYTLHAAATRHGHGDWVVIDSMSDPHF